MTIERTPHPSWQADPDISRTVWEKAAFSVLQKASLDNVSLLDLDGIIQNPLATSRDHPHIEGLPGQFPFTRGKSTQTNPNHPWDICQAVATPDPVTANQHCLQELEGGASSLWLMMSGDGHAGICVPDQKAMQQVLQGVDTTIAGIALQPSQDSAKIASLLVEYLEGVTTDLNKLDVSFGFSPCGQALITGEPVNMKPAVSIAKWTSLNAKHATSISLSADRIHDAGGSETMELAWLCAEIAMMMRTLLQNGLTPDQAAAQIEARIALDANFHLGIAKLRAARRIYARVMQVFDVSESFQGLYIHAVSSNRMLSRLDAWSNILRTSCAAFASILGGANRISVTPFTQSLGYPDEMARRLARNTQLVLGQECAAARVIDPAGGSYYHEDMSNKLANAAWSMFQEIEANGGLSNTLEQGWWQQKLDQCCQARTLKLRTRKTSIIGVNVFAKLDEQAPETLAIKPKSEQAWQFRDSSIFEKIRETSNTMADRPTVFLAAIGSSAASAPRSGFIGDLLTAGGMGHVMGTTWLAEEPLLNLYKQLKIPLAIICGNDKDIQNKAEQIARELKENGAREVWVAGGPDLLNDSHLDRRIKKGDDIVTILQSALSCLEGQK